MPSSTNTAFVNYAWRRFPFCAWCLRYLEHRRAVTCDHFIPKHCGGSDYWSNLLTACEMCINGRGHSLPGTGCKAWFTNPDGTPGTYDRPHGPRWLDVGRKRRAAVRRVHLDARDPCAPGGQHSTARPLTEAAPALATWYCDCPRCQDIRAKLPDLTTRPDGTIARVAIIAPPTVVRATLEAEDGTIVTSGLEALPALGQPIVVEAARDVPAELIQGRTGGREATPRL